jgi:hypothetical protein
MPTPYKARLDERVFLNLPGFHGGAYVIAYVEDTSGREPYRLPRTGKLVPEQPRLILELADCNDRIELEFELYSEAQRENSMHKVETLIATLQRFRLALDAEARLIAGSEQALARTNRRRLAERSSLRLVRR